LSTFLAKKRKSSHLRGGKRVGSRGGKGKTGERGNLRCTTQPVRREAEGTAKKTYEGKGKNAATPYFLIREKESRYRKLDPSRTNQGGSRGIGPNQKRKCHQGEKENARKGKRDPSYKESINSNAI